MTKPATSESDVPREYMGGAIASAGDAAYVALNPPYANLVSVGKASGTDDTALINAAIAQAMTTDSGGTVLLTDTVTPYVCLGALVIPFTGPTGFPVQKPLRITGLGDGGWNGYWNAGPINGGTVLDLRYAGGDGTHVAKIDTRGAGKLEIDHLSLKSGGSDDYPFWQTTNTTVFPHHLSVVGNAAKSGVACVQDFLFCGGTTTTIDNSSNAAFQGYGTAMTNCFFSNIRRIFVGQTYCNSVVVEDNTVSLTCGNSTGGCIEFHGQVSGSGTGGNFALKNTIEVTNYLYGITGDNCFNSYFGPNGFYDPTATHKAAYAFGFGATGTTPQAATLNMVIDGYRADTYPFMLEAPNSANTNTVLTAHQSQPSIYPQPLWSTGFANFLATSTTRGPQFYAPAGNIISFLTQDTVFGNPYPIFQIISTAGTSVNDAQLYNASRIVTSLTAAFVGTDVGLVIGRVNNATIPPISFILAVYTTSTAPAWAALTAYALGDVVRPAAANAHMYQCTTAGTSAGAQPTFPTNGTTVNDGTAVWLDIGAVTAAVMSQAAIATVAGATVGWSRQSTQLNMTGFARHHVISSGNAPSGAADAAAGGSPTFTPVVGNDLAHTVSITIGTTPSSGQLCHWNAAINYAGVNTPVMGVTPKSAAAGTFLKNGGYFTNANNQWRMIAAVAPTAADVITFDILTVQ